MHTFGHFAVCEFGNDNGAVDQHADRHDGAKQNHHVDGQAGQVQEKERRAKRARYRNTNQQGILNAQNTDQHDKDENYRRRYIIDQAVDVFLDVIGFVS